MKEIIYVAELDADIDDIIAAEYLFLKNALKGIVLDPEPTTLEGKKRKEDLIKKGVTFYNDIPPCDAIFVGGKFSKVKEYLKSNKVDFIIANGGFVGSNIIPVDKQLDKFKNKKYVRTFNFNLDVNSTVEVLNSKNVKQICLIGKNVCHNIKNTTLGIWKNEEFLKKYTLKPEKRLHDLLMVQEGLKLIEDIESDLLYFEQLNPVYEKLEGIYTKWGSEPNGNKIVATNWK